MSPFPTQKEVLPGCPHGTLLWKWPPLWPLLPLVGPQPRCPSCCALRRDRTRDRSQLPHRLRFCFQPLGFWDRLQLLRRGHEPTVLLTDLDLATTSCYPLHPTPWFSESSLLPSLPSGLPLSNQDGSRGQSDNNVSLSTFLGSIGTILYTLPL